MGGLFLVQTHDPDFAEDALCTARAQFAQHGFTRVGERSLPGWKILHAGSIAGGEETLAVRGEDFAFVAGSLTCDGKLGVPALFALLDCDFNKPIDWTRLGGQFVALVHKNGRSFLFNDFFAAFQIFHDEELRIFSTSLLSAAGALPSLSFDRQSVYEFAFNVVPIGNATIFNELKLLGPHAAAELGPRGAELRAIAKPLPERVQAMPLAERVALHRDRLLSVVRPYVARFGDRVFCPLSGGIDSRLLLAALNAEGCRPSVYVYGSKGDADVRIAEAIGRAQGFKVEWINKADFRDLPPEAFAEQVERNFHTHDGLPNFGGLFDNGGNAAAREARHAGGALAASGGCGEIYRNFFFLPDRPISAAAVARTFFARYAKGDVTGLFEERQFLRCIEDKILEAVAAPGERGPLPRAVVEQIYPRVRCRSLFGKEISDEARQGAYLMPFLDHRVVEAGVGLPMTIKNAGHFEAMLLNDIDPGLARQPSAYGHDFAGPPNRKHRFGEWSTRIRPAWVRQRSYAVRRRLGPVADEHGGLLTPQYLGRVIDLEYPWMRSFFRVDRIGDSGMLRRIACLEYMAAKMGSRLLR